MIIGKDKSMNTPGVSRKADLLKALALSVAPIVVPITIGNVAAAANKAGFAMPGAVKLSSIAGRLKTGGAGTNTTKTAVDVLLNDKSILRRRLDYVLKYVAADEAPFSDATDAAWTSSATSDPIEFCALADDRLYIGHNKPFTSLWFDSAVAGDTGAATFKYSKAADTTVPTGALTVKNGSIATAKPFAADGLLAWTMPSDWAKKSINGISAYWISIALAATITTAPQADEIWIADDLILIDAGTGSVEVVDANVLASAIAIAGGGRIAIDVKAVPETTPPTDLLLSFGLSQ